jgi:hypothetical protein
MYSRIADPPANANNTKPRRTRVGSMFRYSAIPPQTPAIILFWLDLQSLRGWFDSALKSLPCRTKEISEV